MTYTINGNQHFGKVQNEGGIVATGVTVIPSLGTEKPSILSFGSPITTLNLDFQLTGANTAALTTSLNLWINSAGYISQQANLNSQASTFAIVSDLTGSRNVKITEFSWNWSFAPSNNLVVCKVAFTEGSGL